MSIQVRCQTSQQTYAVPYPQAASVEGSSFLSRIASSVKNLFKSKEEPTTSFAKGIEKFMLHQEGVKKFRSSFKPEEDHLRNGLYVSRRTNVDKPLLDKVAACVKYLEQNAKPKKDTETFERYKIKELSFTMHWKGQALVSYILHLKKKKREDYKSSGGFSQVSKAVEFFPDRFRLLAESCNKGDEKARPIWIDYKHENVLSPPFYPSYTYMGKRVVEEEDRFSKRIIEKKVTFTEFLETDLLNFFDTANIKSPRFLLNILIKVANGLEAIHKYHAYRDLKLENVMLTLNDAFKITSLKIIDLACKHHPLASDKWFGTADYWPPHEKDKIPKEKQDKPSDIYAFGVLCEELKEKAPGITLPKEFQELMDSCKQVEPKNRPVIGVVKEKLQAMLTKPKSS